MEKLIADKYRLENTLLGVGGFSEVYLGRDITTKELVAIKKISLNDEKIQHPSVFQKVQFELDLMPKLSHHNIVHCHKTVKTVDIWYVIMEYCGAGTLKDVIHYNERNSKSRNINFNREHNTYYYLNQLKIALQYIKTLGYVHRDLKPDNVLLTRGIPYYEKESGIINYDFTDHLIVKLADFGLAKTNDVEEEMMNTYCGSPLYMAPEILTKNSYNSKSDLWSFGVIMYQLMYGHHPVSASSVDQLAAKIKNVEINFHTEKSFSYDCVALLKGLLTKIPEERIDWDQLFGHKWFSNWDNQKTVESDINFNNSITDMFDMNLSDTIPESIEFSDSPLSGKSPPSDLLATSPLGTSNLSKMKPGSFTFRPISTGQQPASYPPSTTKKNIDIISLSKDNRTKSEPLRAKSHRILSSSTPANIMPNQELRKSIIDDYHTVNTK